MRIGRSKVKAWCGPHNPGGSEGEGAGCGWHAGGTEVGVKQDLEAAGVLLEEEGERLLPGLGPSLQARRMLGLAAEGLKETWVGQEIGAEHTCVCVCVCTYPASFLMLTTPRIPPQDFSPAISSDWQALPHLFHPLALSMPC